MHVVYIHQHFSTPDGSTGTRSYEMARRLIERGHQVTMVCGSYGGGNTGLTSEPVNGIRRGKVDGINVIEICLPYSNHDSFMRRSITFIRFALKNICIVLNTRYDLLFATSTPLTAGIPGIVMRILKPRTPFIFEVRDLWPELPKAMGVIKNPVILAALSLLEWMSYNCATACIGLSPGIVEGIKRRCLAGKTVVMIPNGCDNDLFADKGEPASLKETQNLSESKFRAIFMGAHGIANGLDAVLDAALVLKRMGRDDVQIVFLGDGKLKRGLSERAKQENLANCLFLDPIPKKELVKLLQSIDVGLMILANVPAFYYGTSPNKFFDYISAGLPVVNNYPGWLADIITGNECGVAVPPEEPEVLAAALAQLAEHPDLVEAMGTRARALAESVFSRERLSIEFAVFLERSVPHGQGCS